jgi:hypothetical protein
VLGGAPARRVQIVVNIVVIVVMNTRHWCLQNLAAMNEVRGAERRSGQSRSTCRFPFIQPGLACSETAHGSIAVCRIGERRFCCAGMAGFPHGNGVVHHGPSGDDGRTGSLVDGKRLEGVMRGRHRRVLPVSNSGDQDDQPLAHSIWRSSPKPGRISTRISVLVCSIKAVLPCGGVHGPAGNRTGATRQNAG